MKKSDLASRVCLALALTFVSATWAAERQAKFAVSDQQMQALGIQIAPLRAEAAPVIVRLPAQVVVPPNREQMMSAPVAGLVAQLFVQQNQAVKPGAPLLRIVSPELGQLQLQVMQSSTRATLARQAAQRERALFDEGIIPQRRVQEAEAALRESEAALYQAKAAMRLTGFSAAAIDRLAVSGKPEDSLILRAVQAGVVTSIDVKLGQRVEASAALLRLAQTDILWLDIQAPAADAANWKPGAKVTVQGRDVAARIASAGSNVSASSQTVTLRAVVDAGANSLRAGEFVTVELPSAVTSEGWDVPLSAVVHDDSQAYVFVRSANHFEARPVKVTASAGQRVRIQGALKAGETIATSGIVALKGAWLEDKGDK